MSNDPHNCNGCGVNCATHEVCQSSSCQCVAPDVLCGTVPSQVCTDTQIDPANCGGCGAAYACANNESCVNGACVANGSSAGGNTITQPGPGVRNVVAVTVDNGPSGGYINGAFVSVQVCVPSTTTCQTIDHVLVDTGSIGLRLLTSGNGEGGELSLSLPAVNDAGGSPVASCAGFLSSYSWGPVARADIKMAGEVAANIPLQVVSEQTYGVPAECKKTGVSMDTLASMGANGILGIGALIYDCGYACAPGTVNNPGVYYSCSATTFACAIGTLALASQVVNPVAKFALDNDGTILELPLINPAGSAPTIGSLVFGINTLSNNQLGTSTMIPQDACAQFSTTYASTVYLNGFMDSGSNGLFILDDTILLGVGIHMCTGSNVSFYCTTAGTTVPVNLTATNSAQSGQNGLVNFGVADAKALVLTGNIAFPDLAGPMATSTSCGTGQAGGPAFDWGLPFFFGRNVYTSIENPSTPGVGIYVAYN